MHLRRETRFAMLAAQARGAGELQRYWHTHGKSRRSIAGAGTESAPIFSRSRPPLPNVRNGGQESAWTPFHLWLDLDLMGCVRTGS